MRLLLALLIIGGSSVARADGMKYTPLVDVDDVDAGCRMLAQTPQNATTEGPSLDAAISTANCVAMARLRGLVLSATADSVRTVDDAMAPALAILDRVIKMGDAEHKVVAYYAKVDLLEGAAARMLAALPRLSPQMSKTEVVEHQRLVGVAGPLVEPWLHRATNLRRNIARVVAAHPELTSRDATIAYMIGHTRIVDAAGLASR